jgi:hypothetical protein
VGKAAAAAAAESINAAAGGRRGRDAGGTGRERGEDCLPASLSWPVVPAWVLWHPHAVIQPHCVQPAVMVKKNSILLAGDYQRVKYSTVRPKCVGHGKARTHRVLNWPVS